MQPEVTIYITNYNYGKYISKAIDSCLKQTFKDIEILIIDDGSTDNSKKIINSYTRKYPTISSIFKKNQGLIKACNTALKDARGRYILRLDADDWLDKNAIEIMHSKLEKNKDVQLVFPDYYEVNEKGNILHTIRRHDFDKVKLFDQSAHGACTLFRTKTLILNGGYDENFTRQDGLDIWLRYYKKYKVMNLNIPLFYYRRHGANLTENKGKILENRNEILFKNNKNKNKKIIAFVPIRGEKFDKFSNVFNKIKSKYLIDWTLDNLCKSKLINDIIVSSPDQKVLNYIKKKKNSKLISLKRNILLASQSVSLDDSITFVLKKYKKLKGYIPEYILLSKLNCPFRNYKHLDNAINTIQLFDLDVVYGVSIENKIFFKHNGKTLKPLRTLDRSMIRYPGNKKVNIRVESEEIYSESGNFILYNSKKFLLSKNKQKIKIGHEILDKLSSFEVNNKFDWLIADNIAKKFKKFSELI